MIDRKRFVGKLITTVMICISVVSVLTVANGLMDMEVNLPTANETNLTMMPIADNETLEKIEQFKERMSIRKDVISWENI